MIFKLIFCLVALVIVLSNCSTTRPMPISPARSQLSDTDLKKLIASKREPAILFIGNSYSFQLARAFRKAASFYGKKPIIGEAVHSGWTLQRHSTDPLTLAKIHERAWDAIIIQEHSLVPSYPPTKRDALMLPALHLLVKEARAVGALPVLFQTWGRRDGYHRLPGDDFFKMNQRVRAGYHAAAANNGGLLIIPVGDRWQQEMNMGRGLTFYQKDGSHPSSKGTRWIAGVIAEFFFSA